MPLDDRDYAAKAYAEYVRGRYKNELEEERLQRGRARVGGAAHKKQDTFFSSIILVFIILALCAILIVIWPLIIEFLKVLPDIIDTMTKGFPVDTRYSP